MHGVGIARIGVSRKYRNIALVQQLLVVPEDRPAESVVLVDDSETRGAQLEHVFDQEPGFLKIAGP